MTWGASDQREGIALSIREAVLGETGWSVALTVAIE